MRDGVYEHIRADILACVLAPGSLVRENDLAGRYAVSKSPVRDALLRLQEQGLVAVLPRKGYRIMPISLRDAQDLYEMRLILETASVKKAAADADAADLAGLDRFRRVDDRAGLAAWVAYNRDFHRALADISGNARLAKATRDVIEQFDRLTFIGVSNFQSEIDPGELAGEHRAIIDAVQDRDKRAAGRLIGAHIKQSRKRLFAAPGGRKLRCLQTEEDFRLEWTTWKGFRL